MEHLKSDPSASLEDGFYRLIGVECVQHDIVLIFCFQERKTAFIDWCAPYDSLKKSEMQDFEK